MELTRRGVFGLVAAAIAGPRAGKLGAEVSYYCLPSGATAARRILRAVWIDELSAPVVATVSTRLAGGDWKRWYPGKIIECDQVHVVVHARRGESVRFCAPVPASASVIQRADVQT